MRRTALVILSAVLVAGACAESSPSSGDPAAADAGVVALDPEAAADVADGDADAESALAGQTAPSAEVRSSSTRRGVPAAASGRPSAPRSADRNTSAPRTATRTAPYDYGCAVELPCIEQYDEARNGRLRAVRSARPCMGYSLPPAPRACGWDVQSAAGIRVGKLELARQVRMSAVVRLDTSLASRDLHACLAVVDRTNGSGIYEVGCTPIPASGTLEITGAEDTSSWMAQEATVWVALRGEGGAYVDQISYTVIE